jgi:hypothetical protein
MTAEARAVELKERAARWVVAKQREKDKKLAEEKAKQAEILQSVHAMLKGEVVT